ncbi:MAG: Pyridine nucleotide-disulfide oxidoreductase domain protein [Candidatus Magasanikbacteria bacterium GW2011_GWC2_42_27]|nr:MAG: Pyridine nucleotide-disulfide oxidoreductase domain protein [Candidatus Magasanikbacteria bacterium GW2011_GWC2_42_27]
MHLKHTFIDTIETCGDEPVSLNIVGGGYTGIEVAGQYADLAKKDLKKLYPHKKIVIRILQAGDTILPYMPIKVQKKVTKKLTQEGVLIDTQTKVTKVTKQSITLSDGRTLPSDITIWTAGFETEGKTFLKTGTNDHGRVSVTGELLMEGYDHTYALGDIAHIQDPKTNIAYPQLAEAAYHEGQYAAKHIARSLKHKHTGPFRFHSKGQLMPVGDWYGVAQIGPFLLFGKLAWWIRRTVYVLFMPGFLRKIRIVFDWTIHSFGVRDVISVDVANVEKRM